MSQLTDRIQPWYLVLEAWHPVPHLGLDGFRWPLDLDHPASRELRASMEPFPLSPGGCLWEVCFDKEAAERYFQAARATGARVYLIEVAEADGATSEVSGYDVGRPEGGFSITGQEICKSREAFRELGHLVNDCGLFPSREVMACYLADRESRLETEGLEHLDESLEVAIRVLHRPA